MAAGATTTVDFTLDTSGDLLTVDDLSTNPATPRPSARGVFVPFNAASLPMVELHVRGAPNRRVLLAFDTVLTPTIVNGQLRQVAKSTGPGAPASVAGFTDANGDFVFQLQIKSPQGLRNVFAQAIVGVGSDARVSNVVNVWVTRP